MRLVDYCLTKIFEFYVMDEQISIEEEGKKFIEENVALNWKNQTLDAVNESTSIEFEKEQYNLMLIVNVVKFSWKSLQQDLVSLAEKINCKKKRPKLQQHSLYNNSLAAQPQESSVFKKEREELLQHQCRAVLNKAS